MQTLTLAKEAAKVEDSYNIYKLIFINQKICKQIKTIKMRVLRIIFLTVIGLYSSHFGFAQMKCGTDQRHMQNLKDINYKEKFEETRIKIMRQKNNLRSNLLIPVDFISMETLHQQICVV